MVNYSPTERVGEPKIPDRCRQLARDIDASRASHNAGRPIPTRASPTAGWSARYPAPLCGTWAMVVCEWQRRAVAGTGRRSSNRGFGLGYEDDDGGFGGAACGVGVEVVIDLAPPCPQAVPLLALGSSTDHVALAVREFDLGVGMRLKIEPPGRLALPQPFMGKVTRLGPSSK